MDSTVFDDLERTLGAEGPIPAIDRLCSGLRERKEYGNLFYALLLKKRHELGVLPVPTAPSQSLPPALHTQYEDAIREAGREIGQLFLNEGDIPQAWVYLRMLGEPARIAAALDRYQPKEDEDIQQLVHIAFYEGVNPRKGFEWILTRFGLCNAITTLSSQDLGHPTEVRQACIQRLVRALYEELTERLRADIERREGKPPAGRSVLELMAGREWLFEDEFYHIDVSHLGSVVQMSVNLGPSAELDLARELCTYGQKLSPRFQYAGDPPFEDRYRDHGVYLAILAGDNVDQGLAHFHKKADDADPESVGTYPAEVLVNLLLRLDRPQEALEVARKHLARPISHPLSCPSIVELCMRTEDYRALAEVARDQGDAVHFLAGLLGETGSPKREARAD
jgi:hypothetical protein